MAQCLLNGWAQVAEQLRDFSKDVFCYGIKVVSV